jgi:hypothetical protein
MNNSKCKSDNSSDLMLSQKSDVCMHDDGVHENIIREHLNKAKDFNRRSKSGSNVEKKYDRTLMSKLVNDG